MKSWGENSSGKLGNGSQTKSFTPVNVSNSTGMASTITSVASGQTHACAISMGDLYCWGSNSYGQLGVSTPSYSSTPMKVSNLASVVAVAVGYEHTCAIVFGGDLYCWGRNNYGQVGLGNNTTATYSSPQKVTSLTNVVAVTSKGSHTCAVNASGDAYCWGNGGYGVLGGGSISSSYAPTAVNLQGIKVISISSNLTNTCVVLASGAIKCWGKNDIGQTGYTPIGNNNTSPASNYGVTAGATAIAVGMNSSCAIVNGGVKCWGDNSFGQLGDGTITNASSGTSISISALYSGVTEIAAGEGHFCAVKNGLTYCWGKNDFGQIGNGSIAGGPSPQTVTFAGVSTPNPTSVTASKTHACAIVNGGVYCWGNNLYGQLGNATTGINGSATPVAVSDTNLSSNVTAVVAGLFHTCALKGGQVYCWGINSGYQLGVASSSTGGSTNTPTAVPIGLTQGESITKISSAYGNHTCAVSTLNNLYCWGVNSYGQLAGGVSVGSTGTAPVLSATGATDVTAGSMNTCMINSAGGLSCWGSNSSGLIGNGTTSSTPVISAYTFSGLSSGVTSASVGTYLACAVKGTGMSCWGSMVAQYTPTLVSGLSSVTQLSTGPGNYCVVANGTSYCYGTNDYGQCGESTYAMTSQPYALSGLNGSVEQFSAGDGFTCSVVNNNGTRNIKCWGLNTQGQLGSSTGQVRSPVQISI